MTQAIGHSATNANRPRQRREVHHSAVEEQEMRLQGAQEEIEALEKQIFSELVAELSGVSQGSGKPLRASRGWMRSFLLQRLL